MQSEHFDKKIRDAADLHHPAYDEKAWGKMEKMLDKHLPQEKDDRRRILFFLLLFLLIGGGVTSALLLTRGKKEPVAQTPARSGTRTTNDDVESTKPGHASGKPSTAEGVSAAVNNNPQPGEDVTRTTIDPPVTSSQNQMESPRKQPEGARETILRQTQGGHTIPLPAMNKLTAGKPAANKVHQEHVQAVKNRIDLVNVEKNRQEIKAGDNPINANKQLTPATSSDKPAENKTDLARQPENPKESGSVIESNKNREISTRNQPETRNEEPATSPAGGAANTVIAAVKQVEKKENAITKTKADKPIKIKNRRTSYFLLNFSAGPDVSMVGKGGAGKMNLMAGLGLGYTYKNRLTIRTGFYAANKVYSADPGDYHPPYRFYYYYPNLQKIDANCRVYEIPVSLSYQFGNNKKQNWFVSSGVSSYLMKRETYNYFYKQDPSQPTVNKQRTMTGVNKHYFSVLTVSGGYQKNISRSVSLTVEPYLKMPLKGVGYGKVLLNSSGVMFTVGVKPFSIFSKGK